MIAKEYLLNSGQGYKIKNFFSKTLFMAQVLLNLIVVIQFFRIFSNF